ncbi:MAG: glycosyltransferase family 2 protein [Erysipelotrichia bacterium]|nr:glycosyltransferase family 2 protein [Erysipelotrichia bacterium]
MNKVSIIVPVYKVEPYILRCVDSLVNQTYKNIEIILVDDGSPDNSIDLVKENYNDERIVIVRQSNQGSGQARNNGIKRAVGQYLFFVDGDDFIEENTLELMINRLEEDNSSLVICDYYKYFTDDD